jgi:hypothetical protein
MKPEPFKQPTRGEFRGDGSFTSCFSNKGLKRPLAEFAYLIDADLIAIYTCLGEIQLLAERIGDGTRIRTSELPGLLSEIEFHVEEMVEDARFLGLELRNYERATSVREPLIELARQPDPQMLDFSAARLKRMLRLLDVTLRFYLERAGTSDFKRAKKIERSERLAAIHPHMQAILLLINSPRDSDASSNVMAT